MIHIVEASRSKRLGALLAVVLVGMLGACGPSDSPPPESRPDVDTLRASFIAQIESIDLVAGLETDGDEVRFVRPDGSGQDVEWRVRIDSLELESGEGEGAQVLGRVRSAWSADGRPITVQQGPAGLVTDMPQWLLDAGLAPAECWALWDEEAKAWGWT